MGWSSLFGQIDSSRKKFRGKMLNLWDQSSGVKSLICLPFGALKAANSRTGLPGLVAEVKKASPSRGVLREDFDPVKQLHNWLSDWNKKFLNTDQKEKGKKQNDLGAKKAVRLSGNPGIGKTTSAKLVSQMLGLGTIEVNASDSRGKADAKIEKGIGGSTSNSMKELVSNEALSLNMECSQCPKTVLIMDEVDGMSAGDRGGVADLITSIKISKIPTIMCNEYKARVYVCRENNGQGIQNLEEYFFLKTHKEMKE